MLANYQSVKAVIVFCLIINTLLCYPSAQNQEVMGRIYYHLNFPTAITEQTESLTLDSNTADLVISNFVAGAMYAYLINHRYPNLYFNQEYLKGSLFAQLLQENLQTNGYKAESNWINPDEAIRNMLLAPGQGGPYQINDYGKRLEHGLGLINFVVLQKSLDYRIEDQDSGEQTLKQGPIMLDNKYFGPLAAAFFQYNTMLRLEAINKDPWGPSANDFGDCMANLKANPNNFLDMILNAAYNAGPWANITKTYINLCANLTNPSYADKIKHINDYSLADIEYQQAVGTNESAGSTFILYPRQIRVYLDQLYNNPTSLNTYSSTMLPLSLVREVFSQAMNTLAYEMNNRYELIPIREAQTAFDDASSALSLNNQSIDLGDYAKRQQFFELLDLAIANLAGKLNIDFAETTEMNLNS
ncbi:hypothetical protein [Legionella maceachernii]|uniref:Uncharacterized protein n=1 Tax=Legionella maceachernii TaxID=466 RepID=A0A0W0VZN9_9GAMM|nr:hypothetical protein [Legionella maceachernii]KTD25637.1 hypothetical protein Lmac_2001 [Legionella maceachernii]SJZ58235.1 hypothetical protein SAMN02745128_00493 [Legionella maceachernii]SUP00703.1 Uncharacterised protein [Legionella maceachernii]